MSPPKVKLDAMDALAGVIRARVNADPGDGGNLPNDDLAAFLTALALADMASSLQAVAGFCNENFYALTNLGIKPK